MLACVLSHFNCVWFFATLWTVAHQAPLSMGVSRQEYWSELPCPSPGDLPDPGIEPAPAASPTLQVDSLPTEPPGKLISLILLIILFFFNWSKIALQCSASFCYLTTWTSYLYTNVPCLEPPSHSNPHPTHLGQHWAELSLPSSRLPLASILHTVVYTCQNYSPNLSYPLLPTRGLLSVPYIWISLPALQIGPSVPLIYMH